jgi:glycosyltransferase involved in cell wall biosynthesis
MKKGPLIHLLESLELFLYRRADTIVSVTESFREDLAGRGIARNKIEVVLNGADLSWCAPRPRDPGLATEFGLDDKFVVGYLGTHGMAHGLTNVLEAAENLRGRDDVAFLFAGGGAERANVERLAHERGLDNVRMIPQQPKERVAALWSLCDLALIPLRNDPVFSTVIPSKLFEAVGNGVPVLMSLPEGEATAMVKATGCGVTVPPDNPAAMAEAIAELADDSDRMAIMRATAHAAAPGYSRENRARHMAGVLQEVVTSSRHGGGGRDKSVPASLELVAGARPKGTYVAGDRVG